MRKITSLLMLFFAFVGMAWAGPTDLPTLTEDLSNPVFYAIKNTRSTKYANYEGDAAQMSQVATLGARSLFYFTASGEAENGYTPVKIHALYTDKLLNDFASWTEEGSVWYLSTDVQNETAQGLHITKTANVTTWSAADAENNAWNDQNGSAITKYYGMDAGSVFVIEEVADPSALIDVPAAKTAAIAELQNLAMVSVVYPATTEAEAAVNAVVPAGNDVLSLYNAVKEIDAVVANYKQAAYQALAGKLFFIATPARATCGYMQMSTNNVVGTETANSPANLWQFVYNNGFVNIYNPYTKKYLCEPAASSVNVAVTTDQAQAGNYVLNVNAAAENANAQLKFTSNGKSVHMAGGGSLVRWDNGGASEWFMTEVTDFSDLISAYKTATLATMDSWATLSVVFDAALIANAKAKVDAIATTNWETFAAIDAELKNVTDAVAAKMFTFQTLATDNHREGVWVSANPATGKAIGLHGEHNYNSIWSLRHAGGVSFYMFNELNQVYMGNPSGNCVLSAEPTAAYTFEIIDAENGVVEMKCGGETMHASNHADDKLLNWDGDEAASRWYIRTIDVASDIQAILDGLTAEDYAEVPALGQYPTAAYEALVAARTNAKTVEAVNAAIDAFNKSKNLPVFTISGTKDYVLGKSIYDNNSGTLYFKATNIYDKSMWWAFDQTETTVGVTEKVVVTNVATGNKFWGANSLKVTETAEADETDGVFLLYTEGNGTPVHYQNDNQVIVRWSSTDAASGSAMTFTYVGNTYDLKNLTEEKIAALAALQLAADSVVGFVNAEIGTALGQYSGSKDAIATAAVAAQAFASKTLVEQALTSVEDINALAATLKEAKAALGDIVLPELGKFYRIKGAHTVNEYSNYYITGHTNEDGGRIALTKEADASTIYYYTEDKLDEDKDKLLSYSSGLYIGLNSGHWTFASVDGTTKPASEIEFAGSPRTAGTFTIKSADRYLHYYHYTVNNTVQVNRCQDDVCKEHDWVLEEVNALPVTIVDTLGYATLFAPVALTIPAEVTAYIGYVEGDVLKLTAIEGNVIPARTAVVLQAAAGTYNFEITEDVPALEGNELFGLVASEVSEDGICTLQNINGVVGFHKYTGANLNGFKAFLAGIGAQTLTLNFGGATGIENITTVLDVNAPIYDLAGRRVNAATKGIFIQNGKKIVVK